MHKTLPLLMQLPPEQGTLFTMYYFNVGVSAFFSLSDTKGVHSSQRKTLSAGRARQDL